MNRADHLKTAETMLKLVDQLEQDIDQRAAAAEMVWGATVHALSAADPAHETVPPNKRESAQGITHTSPNSRHPFEESAKRVSNLVLPLAHFTACLQNNQGNLHTHFYHGNLSSNDLDAYMKVGIIQVRGIITLARAAGV